MEVLCFRLLSKIIDKIVMRVHFPFNNTSSLNYTKFERDLIKWCPQSALNYSLEITTITTSANCNRLHYFNAWNIHKFSYRNDKTIESDEIGHFVFLNARSIVRKLLGPLALKNIYCTYLIFFAGKLAELPHTPTCFISCWEKR